MMPPSMIMNPKERCPVCAQHTIRRTFSTPTSRGMRQWSRCSDCRAYFDCQEFDLEAEVSHTRVQAWGNLAGGSELAVNKRPMYLSVLRLLNRYAAPKSSLLDVGCSCGGFLEEARRQGYVASGLDIVPEMAEYCRKQGFTCHIGASVAELEVPDSSLKIISVLDCNCYWPDQMTELRAIGKKLRASGLLVMRVVDKSWMLTAGLALRSFGTRLGDKICARAVNDHRVSIPVQSMLRIMRQEGFAILYASPAGASHGAGASLAVKINFALGYLIYLLSRQYFAPGCLILARKETS
jgi:SAM-dependent methyltransferase